MKWLIMDDRQEVDRVDSWWTEWTGGRQQYDGGVAHQCHFKVVSCGGVIQFDLVPDLIVTEMSPEVFLLLSILNKGDKKFFFKKSSVNSRKKSAKLSLRKMGDPHR